MGASLSYEKLFPVPFPAEELVNKFASAPSHKEATPAKDEPCQQGYDEYVACTKKHNGTIDMIDCEDIAILFQQCMRDERRKKDGADAVQLLPGGPGHQGGSKLLEGKERRAGFTPGGGAAAVGGG